MKTTIQISPETKEMISSFGMKGESFETIIKRLFELAKKEQLRQFLMPSDEYVSLDEFEQEVNKKWPKSK